MDTIRATHKFLFLQLTAIFVITYAGLPVLRRRYDLMSRLIFICVICLFVFGPIVSIISRVHLIRTVMVPKDYFSLNSYLSRHNEKTIYMPYHLPPFVSMIGNYSWVREPLPNFLYTNPFSSLFALDSFVYLERPHSNPHSFEQVALYYHTNSPTEIAQAMRTHGIHYVIVDRHFDFQNVLPSFKVDELVKNFTLEKEFGALQLYRVEPSATCPSAYGDYHSAYCFTNEPFPSTLIRRSVESYYLDKLSREDTSYAMTVKEPELMRPYIVDPKATESLFLNKVQIPLLPQPPFTFIEPQKHAFIAPVEENTEYVVALPIVYFADSEVILGNSSIHISVDDQPIDTVPVTGKTRYEWTLKTITTGNTALQVEISPLPDIQGYITMYTPLMFKKDEWTRLQQEWRSNGYTPSIVE